MTCVSEKRQGSATARATAQRSYRVAKWDNDVCKPHPGQRGVPRIERRGHLIAIDLPVRSLKLSLASA